MLLPSAMKIFHGTSNCIYWVSLKMQDQFAYMHIYITPKLVALPHIDCEHVHIEQQTDNLPQKTDLEAPG